MSLGDRIRDFLLLAMLSAVSVAVLCGTSAIAEGSSVQSRFVQATLDREDVELARPFSLRLRIRHQAGEGVLWPRASALGPEFEELSRHEIVKAGAAAGTTMTSELIIEMMAFDTEVTEVPPLSIQVVGSSQIYRTRSLPLQVEGSINSKDRLLRPMRTPVSVPVRNDLLLFILALPPLLLLLALLGYFLGRRFATSKPLAVGPLRGRPPAHEEALARLADLEASGLLEASSRKEAYLSMSEILRDYLGRRFEFSSLDLTSSEINTRLQECSPQRESFRESVALWLSGADLVKYAKSAADATEAKEALVLARTLIEESQDRDLLAQSEAARA